MQEDRKDLSFERDIRPLFRPIDIEHMQPMGVLLDDYEYMSNSQNAEAVHDFLTGAQSPRMPPGGPYWEDEQLTLLEKWMENGRKP